MRNSSAARPASAQPAPRPTDREGPGRTQGVRVRPRCRRHSTATIRPSTAWRRSSLRPLRQALDIGYFRPGETIVWQGEPADSLYVVIKGLIEERAGDEVVAHLGPKDTFDSHALVQGQSRHAFVAREETLCYPAAPSGRPRADPGQSALRRLLLPRPVAQAGGDCPRRGGQPHGHPDARPYRRPGAVPGVLHRRRRQHRDRRPPHERDRRQHAVRARTATGPAS